MPPPASQTGPTCSACGYSLAGLPRRGDRVYCPECGDPDLPDWRPPPHRAYLDLLIASPWLLLVLIAAVVYDGPPSHRPPSLAPFMAMLAAAAISVAITRVVLARYQWPRPASRRHVVRLSLVLNVLGLSAVLFCGALTGLFHLIGALARLLISPLP